MVDLLYTLNLFIPNFGELLGTMGVLLGIFGIVNAFFGYRLFKIMLSITGFLVGAAVGLILFLRNGSMANDAMIAWIVIGGAIGAALADIFHALGVFIYVGSMGAVIVFIITQNTDSCLVLGIICGIVGVIFEKYVIIAATALFGGALTTTGIWFIRLSNGENVSPQPIGWIIGICGIAFQLWMETRRKTNSSKETNMGVVGVVKDTAVEKVLPVRHELSSLGKSNPKEILHNLIYEKDSDEVKSALIKSLLGLPIIIGIILGCLSGSGLFGCGVISVLYILVMAYYVRKSKAEDSPEGYVQKYAWEKWVNKILDKNKLMIFVPIFGGFFIFILSVTFVNNELLNILAGLIGIIGAYVVFFKALSGTVPKEKINSIPIDAEQEEQTTSKQHDNVHLSMRPKTLYCPNCGISLVDDAVFCSGCGSRIQAEETVGEYMFCSECGTRLPSDALFCDNCGAAQNN